MKWFTGLLLLAALLGASAAGGWSLWVRSRITRFEEWRASRYALRRKRAAEARSPVLRGEPREENSAPRFATVSPLLPFQFSWFVVQPRLEGQVDLREVPEQRRLLDEALQCTGCEWGALDKDPKRLRDIVRPVANLLVSRGVAARSRGDPNTAAEWFAQALRVLCDLRTGDRDSNQTAQWTSASLLARVGWLLESSPTLDEASLARDLERLAPVLPSVERAFETQTPLADLPEAGLAGLLVAPETLERIATIEEIMRRQRAAEEGDAATAMASLAGPPRFNPNDFDLSSVQDEDAALRAQLWLLVARCRLETFRRKLGRWPTGSELELPTDPLDVSRCLRWAPTADGSTVRIWSVRPGRFFVVLDGGELVHSRYSKLDGTAPPSPPP